MPFLRIWFATRFQRHHPIENIRSRQLVSYPCILLSMIRHTSYSLHLFPYSPYLTPYSLHSSPDSPYLSPHSQHVSPHSQYMTFDSIFATRVSTFETFDFIVATFHSICIYSLGNSIMVSIAIWEKTCTCEFFKYDQNTITSPRSEALQYNFKNNCFIAHLLVLHFFSCSY